MKKRCQITRNIGLGIILLLALAACDKDDGMMEHAGASIDRAATDAGNAIEDTCEEFLDDTGKSSTNC